MPTNNYPPRVRTVNALADNPALSEFHGESTQAFFRALSEADDFVHARDERDELRCRVDELTAELDEVRKALHVWTEGLITDREAYWRIREILRPKESNDDRITQPKVEKR